MKRSFFAARPSAGLHGRALRTLVPMLALGLAVAAACGGDGGGASPTPSAPGSTMAGETPSRTGGAGGALSASDSVFTFSGAREGDLFTGSHSLALGDFNDDGALDLLVGAPQSDGPDGRRFDGGAAYVVFGPLEGERAAAEADVTVYGSFAGDGLGYAVAAGDLNGDGTDDVLVGAPGVTAGFDPRTDQGRVYVFYGGSDFGREPVLDLETDVFDFTVTGAEGFSRLSNAMAMGDVNGDGTDDLVVGAPFAGRAPGTAPGGPRTTLGEVYVIFGGDELSGEYNIARDEFDVLISGEEAQGQFGGAIALADFNDDGHDDIAVAAHRASAASDRLQSGVVYVFSGGDNLPGRLDTQNGDEDARILGPAASAAFGFPLAAGDFDGDGRPDLAAGAQLEMPDGVLSAGSLRIISGDALSGEIDLAEEDAEILISGSGAGELLPTALAAASGGNDDGAANLVVGVQLAGTGDDLSAGVVYISASGGVAPELSEWRTSITGEASDDRLGNAVAAASAGSSVAVAMLAPGVDGATGNDLGAVYVVFLEDS